jgi:hypothetical protein
LWNKWGEDALQGGPCERNVGVCQVVVKFKNRESIKKTIVGFLVQSILLTHPPYWRKAGVCQHKDKQTQAKAEGK